VRQPVQRGVAVAVRVDAQGELGQRVEAVGVAAELGDQDLRLEGPHERRHDGVERAQPADVAGARRQRDVDRGALRRAVAGLAGEAGAGRAPS
jgi:hypothetical protein